MCQLSVCNCSFFTSLGLYDYIRLCGGIVKCERALSGLRARTLGFVSAYSRVCERALAVMCVKLPFYFRSNTGMWSSVTGTVMYCPPWYVMPV